MYIKTIDNSKNKFKISWEDELEMFLVDEKSRDQIPKKSIVYIDLLIDHLKQFYISQPDDVAIQKIYFYTDKLHNFYDIKYGTVWQKEDCVECIDFFKEFFNCTGKDCNTDEIRKNIKKLLVKYHPDKNKSFKAKKEYLKIKKCKKEILENMCYKDIRHS